MTFDLHIGVHKDAVENVRDTTEGWILSEFYADGDGWEVWGEDYGMDVKHVILRYPDDTALFTILLDLAFIQAEFGLNPMTGPDYQKGVIASITQSEDWSESFYVLTDTHYRNHR